LVWLHRHLSPWRGRADTARYGAVSIKPETLKQLDALSSAQLLDIAMAQKLPPDADPMAIVGDIASTKSAADVARRSNTFGAKYVAAATTDVTSELQDVLDKCLVE
jgi:hypothetical protein